MASVIETSENDSDLKLPDIKGIYEGKFIDRNPDIRTAGKLTATGESAKQCMKTECNSKPKTPDIVLRFRNYVKPKFGEKNYSLWSGL